MACDAWDNVTPETIKNCWNHTDIQRNPIILCVPSTLTQRGWRIIHTFADSSSGMTLPQAEDSLKKVFGDQYNDNNWQPALKIMTKMEPDDDMHSLIKALQEKPHSKINLLSLPSTLRLRRKSHPQSKNSNEGTEYLKVPQAQMPTSSRRSRGKWKLCQCAQMMSWLLMS